MRFLVICIYIYKYVKITVKIISIIEKERDRTRKKSNVKSCERKKSRTQQTRLLEPARLVKQLAESCLHRTQHDSLRAGRSRLEMGESVQSGQVRSRRLSATLRTVCARLAAARGRTRGTAWQSARVLVCSRGLSWRHSH